MNIDIISIHNEIVNQFTNEDVFLPTITGRIDELKTIKHDNDERVNTIIDSDIRFLEEKRHKIITKENVHIYLLQTIPVIEAYKKELATPIKKSFMTKSHKPDERHGVKEKLINEYIQIAKKYVEINAITESTIITCEWCSQTTTEWVNSICACGIEHPAMDTSFSYKDAERINITSKYTYDRRVHFKDCINQFQGKQNSTIHQHVYDAVRAELENHGLLADGGKNITKQHIYMFLKETGNASHYEDLYLIYHNITKRPLSDISHLEDILMCDFDILSELYDIRYIKTKKIQRKNFINTQYVLFQLLRRHKYPCQLSDFNLLKTTDRKRFHDMICSDLFRELGWNFTNIF